MSKVSATLAALVSLSMGWGASAASASVDPCSVNPKAVSGLEHCGTIILSDYQPPDDVDGPSSSQGSGTR